MKANNTIKIMIIVATTEALFFLKRINVKRMVSLRKIT